MKLISAFLAFALATLVGGAADATTAKTAAKIRVLIITGGHGFQEAPFFQMFRNNAEIAFTAVKHTGKSADAWEHTDLAAADVVVLYDAPKLYTTEQQARFRSIFARGTGLMVLHHALLLDHNWTDYERIIGGAYPTRPTPGAPPVGYRGDVDIPVVIVQRDHPITAGMPDFTIHDEIYWGYRVGADVTPLLTTTHPDSGKPLAWSRTEEKSRVVTVQLGHACFADPHYRDLVARCLRWTAQR
jgi:type 1 glutamine amidotransferase